MNEKLFINCDDDNYFIFDKAVEGKWRLLCCEFDRPNNIPVDIGISLPTASGGINTVTDYFIPSGYYTPNQLTNMLNEQQESQLNFAFTAPSLEWLWNSNRLNLVNGAWNFNNNINVPAIIETNNPQASDILGISFPYIVEGPYSSFDETNLFTNEPDKYFLFSNQDSNKKIRSNEFFSATFVVENNNDDVRSNIDRRLKYKNDNNYEQILTLNHPVRNIRWKVFDRNNNEINVTNLLLIMESV